MIDSNIYKNSVQLHEIDNLGHMNVQYYLKHCLDSCILNFKINNLISYNSNKEESFVLEKVNIRYLNEQRLGAPFSINFYISKIENDKILILQEMENLETKKISSTFILSFKIRKQIKMIKNKFENFLMDYPNKFKIAPSYAEIRGLLNINKLKLSYEKLLDYPKIFNTFCGIAKNKDSNNSETLDAADYMGIVSASVPNLLMMSNHSISKTNIGGAAVEYEFYFNEFVKTGTCIKLLSGLRNIKNKTYTWSHWLIDIDKEKILAEANAVIVTMDLKKRKSVQIPNKMKVALEKIILE